MRPDLRKALSISHFENKDELEIETLNYLSSLMFEKLRERIKEKATDGRQTSFRVSFLRVVHQQSSSERGLSVA